MTKLSDYVIQFLVEKGIKDIFLVAGGGIMHLLDSVGRNKGMTYYCNYHEQACAISAEAYARVRNGVGACLVTTGPGGANALSGIAGAWVDSVPVVVISGQVKRDLIADYTQLRQVGPQEGDIIGMAKSVTKYAKTILDPQMIRYELELAFCEAASGRPGPVWLDIPLDVQGSQVDETCLASYDPQDSKITGNQAQLARDVRKVIELIRTSKRPILTCGNGIHLSNSESLLNKLIKRMQIPVVLPYTAKDLVAEDHPMCVGVFGVAGQRRANFAVQNADCLISLATGLNVSKVGFNYRGFAPKAKKIMVDIDRGQLNHQAVKPDIAIRCDIREFLEELLNQTDHVRFEPPPKWFGACARWKQRYPIIVDEFYSDKEHVNSYVFMDTLSDLLSRNDTLVTGNGLDVKSYYQAFKVKVGQRTMINGNWGAMGWGLPAAIGACIGSSNRRTICVTGDGSIKLNIQELLTIGHYGLPIKIFMFNNQGYSSIRVTQRTFFDGGFVGADRSSGVDNPDFAKVANACGLGYTSIKNNGEIEERITRVLSMDVPVICEVNISTEQGVTPKASAFRREDGVLESRPLEDMAPFLPREEVWENMHLFDEDEE